jgi:hypothetical protein
MTATASDLQSPNTAPGPRWRVQEHRIELRGANYRLRLVRFAAGWLASVDTVEGPTLGHDSSPYLAVSRAVEPIGGGLVDAVAIVAGVRATTHALRPAPSTRPGACQGVSEGGASS